MAQSLDLGADLKDRKRQRERSRDSRKASWKSTSSRSGLQHMETSTSDPISERSSVRMPAYLSKTKSEIAEAFLDLEWKQRYRISGAMTDPNSPYKLNRSPNIISRNRYGNIQPWDNSRVQLKTLIDGSDYVNASPIRLHSLSQRAKKRLRRTSSTNSSSSLSLGQEYSYIATQGPKEGQFSHFWHMVMQESGGDVGVIVMLTPCYEGIKEKCAQYFPTDKHDPIVLAPERRGTETIATMASEDESLSSKPTNSGAQTDGGHDTADMTDPGQVELVSSSYDAEIGCMIRSLRLSIGTQQKTIIHYLYEHWPDFGKPEAEERAALLRLMKRSREVAGESPRIVHCSAGVGRTGTFVALDFLIAELEAGRLARRESSTLDNDGGPEPGADADDHLAHKPETYGKSGIAKHKITTPELKQGEVSTTETITGDLIHDTVESLRQQRMMMVMNEVQYSLLYEVVKEAFLDVYASKATGAMIITTVHDDVAGDETHATKVIRTGGDQDMTSSSPPHSPHGSEADTEIADAMSPRGTDDWDPYAEVAPENIRQNLGMQRQQN